MTRRHPPSVGIVALGLAAVAFAAAFVVRVSLIEQVRRLLNFPFDGLTAGPGTVVSILQTNLGLLAGLIAAVLIVQSPWCTAHTASRSPVATVVVSGLDALVFLHTTLNVLVVGASIGAYGLRMVKALLPQAPFELAAYAAGLALYVRARSQPVAVNRITSIAITCAALLVTGAILETYVAL